MDIFAAFPLFAFFINICVGTYAFIRNPKGIINRLYLLFTFSMAAWALGNYFTFTSLKLADVIFWSNIETLGFLFAVTSLLHLILVFIKKKEGYEKHLTLLYIPAAIIILLNVFYGPNTLAIERQWWGNYLIHGPIYPVFSVYGTIVGLLTIFLCYKYYLNIADHEEKINAMLLIGAISIPIASGILTEVVFPFLQIKMMPLTAVLSIFTALIIGYSMVRHGLFGSFYMTIQKKLLVSFLMIIFMLGVFTLIVQQAFSSGLIESQTKNMLLSTAKSRVDSINRYFNEKEADLNIFSQSTNAKDAFAEQTQSSEDYLNKFKEAYRYQDLLVISPEGKILWEAENKFGFGASLDTGRFKDTALAKAYRKSKNSSRVEFSDYGMLEHLNEPALFAAVPVFDKGNLLGVIAVQLDTETIDNILSDQKGLGETGETYLVGSDKLMLSQSRFIKESTVLKITVDTESSRECFDDYDKYGNDAELLANHEEEFTIAEDYRGVVSLGMHAYVPRVKWCLLAEMDEKEAFAMAQTMQNGILLLIIVLVAVGIIFSYALSRSITDPIVKLERAAEELGKGNLAAKADIKSSDEIGELAKIFNEMAAKLNEKNKELMVALEEAEGKTNAVQEANEARLAEMEIKKKAKELEEARLATLNILEDVSEARLELENAYGELKRAEKIKDDFMHIAAHELKTPLTPIRGYVEILLKKKMGELTAQQEYVLKIVHRNTLRLESLIMDILDITRLESNTMKFEIENVDLIEIIGDVRQDMAAFAEKKGIFLKAELPKRLPLMRCDKRRISQAIGNFAKNAINFTKSGGVTLKAHADKESVFVEVIDTGIGISKENMPKLFTKFYQAEGPMRREIGGTGLGLVISKGIIEAQGGSVGVKSELGKGSVFYFSLPIKDNDEPMPPKPDSDPKSNEANAAGSEGEPVAWLSK